MPRIFAPRIARFLLFLTLSLICLLAAGGILLKQISRYNTTRLLLPSGTVIADVPVGGLDAQAAAQRIAQVYAFTPVELRIDGAPVHIDPVAAGQQLDLQAMLHASTESARPYWAGFWDMLMNRQQEPVQSGLICNVTADQLHTYIDQLLGTRYNQPPAPAVPALAGDVLFRPGQPGTVLDLQQAEQPLSAAMCSAAQRVVEVSTSPVDTSPPTVPDLALLLESIVQANGFDGIGEIYFQDLRTGEQFQIAYQNGHSVEPDIAFTAASTIKVPVMVAAYKRIDGELSAELRRQMELMIELSDNGSTDDVLQSVLDENIAPVQVTEDMRAIGLSNTFLAGFFYPGAPLLDRYLTPANQRAGISTDPDIYNQTTAGDMGRLLAAIYRCASSSSGPLVEAYSNQVTQAECQQMIDLLVKNRKGVLIENGLPEGIKMGHKYGWVTDSVDGLMHTASDASIIYTTGGDYILTLYLYDAEQLNWDQSQQLAARLATATYNFYNHWK